MSPEEFSDAVSKRAADLEPTSDGSLNKASQNKNKIYHDEYLTSHSGQEIQDIIKVPGQNKVVVIYPNGDRVDYEGTDIGHLVDSVEYKLFSLNRKK